MTDRTIKVVKTENGYGFKNSIVPGTPDNLDLYTLFFQLKQFQIGTANQAGIGVLKRFAKKYGTKVVEIPA